MPLLPNANTYADQQVICAINDHDVSGLAIALQNGGGAAGTQALHLLLSAVFRRSKCSLHIIPKLGRGRPRGDRDPVRMSLFSPLQLRRGLSDEARAHLIDLCESERVQIGRLRQRKRGPRSDHGRISALWHHGWDILNLMDEISPSAPDSRGVQLKAIKLFLERNPHLGGEDRERYAKRALAKARIVRARLRHDLEPR